MRVRGYAPGTPCWVELISPDPAAAESFYSGLFGWSRQDGEADDQEGVILTEAAGRAVAGLRAGAQEAPAAWLCHIACDDIEAAVSASTTAGGSTLLPITQIGSRGWRAVVTDPLGAVFGLWQHGSFRGAQVINEPNTFSWTELVTPDIDKAERFYQSVFEWKVVTSQYSTPEAPYQEWVLRDRTLAGVRPLSEKHPAGTAAHWSVTVMVADCEQTVQRATELGGQVLVSPLTLTGWAGTRCWPTRRERRSGFCSTRPSC